MSTAKKSVLKTEKQSLYTHRTALAERLWREGWTYIKTVVDTTKESFLLLDKECRVIAGNESFYRMFQVEPEETEGKVVYELGNGEWNIPALRTLIEGILSKNSFFKGFEVAHNFQSIGRRTMLLNSRQIYFEVDSTLEVSQPIILFAIEDITKMIVTAEKIAGYINQSETKIATSINYREMYLSALQNEISEFKK